MNHTYNFSAGPAMIPARVLQQVRDDLPDWQGHGSSVMEISHRSSAFVTLARAVEEDLRALLEIPANYRVLFLQGGATQQFVQVPMNLVAPGQSADYLITGAWSAKAAEHAAAVATVRTAAQGADGFRAIPARDSWQLDADAAYLHYTSNETIHGVQFQGVPDVDVPLVVDMSSDILSGPLDVSRFGLIYACAQKNIGPSGLTLVIIRDDLLARSSAAMPAVFSFSAQAAQNSMLNTPNTFAWYVAGLVFRWLQEQGGLMAMDRRNRDKAKLLYDCVDASSFYVNQVDPGVRSLMNVPFQLADPALDGRFLEQATAAGLTGLKGHRAVGGMRASIYNAMPLAGVQALVDFMVDFERRNG